MNFLPILPVWLLVLTAVVLVGIRMLALYRLLVRTSSGRYRRVVLRWSGLTLAVLLLVMAAARPGVAYEGTPDSADPAAVAGTANLNVFFVVDRSVDSRVEDYAPQVSRLAGMRADMVALMDQYPHARFAVIGFSSKAQMIWPLSDDVWSLKPFIQGLSSYTDTPLDAMYQVNSGAADDILKAKLAQAKKLFPNSKNVVFYLGSGAGGSRAAQSSFSLDDGLVADGAVLGYGTAAGGPIPHMFVNGNLVYMADQQTGAPLISTLDENTLRSVAGQLRVSYHHRDKDQPISGVAPAVAADPAPGSPAVVASQTVERVELYWLFCLLAAVLVLVESTLTVREYRRSWLARQDVAV